MKGKWWLVVAVAMLAVFVAAGCSEIADIVDAIRGDSPSPDAEATVQAAEEGNGGVSTFEAATEQDAESGDSPAPAAEATVQDVQDSGGTASDFEALRQAAEAGDAAAQRDLGHLYARGESVAENYEEAAKWFRLAAEQGDADAQYNLGNMYDFGIAVPQDYEQAAKWY